MCSVVDVVIHAVTIITSVTTSCGFFVKLLLKYHFKIAYVLIFFFMIG